MIIDSEKMKVWIILLDIEQLQEKNNCFVRHWTIAGPITVIWIRAFFLLKCLANFASDYIKNAKMVDQAETKKDIFGKMK